MAAAVKEAAAPAGEHKLVPIADVVVQKGFNNRRALGDVNELSASIKSVGVLLPLLVWKPNGDHRFQLIAGERRLAAAKQAGLKQVPVIIRALDDAGRLEALLVENLMRKDIDPLEEADGYKRLKDLGLKQDAIAAKLGRSEAHISKRLALVGLSPLAAKLLSAGTIPIDAAIALAKHEPAHQDRAIEHVKKNYGKLEDAAPYQLRNLGDRAREEAKKVERSKKKADLKRRLKEAGVAILSGQQSYHWGEPGQPWELGKPDKSQYSRRSRVDLTPKQHSEFDCHAAAVVGGDMWSEPKVVYLCTNPTSHMNKDEVARFKKKLDDSKRDSYEEQQRRREAIRREIHDAHENRLPAIREQLKSFDRQTLLKLALEAFVMESNMTSVAYVLGLDVEKKRDAAAQAVANYCNASEANLIRAAAAAAINIGESAIGSMAESQALGYHDPSDHPQALALADWFKQVGIDLTETEVKALEKAKKK